jgi:hypothetical protein
MILHKINFHILTPHTRLPALPEFYEARAACKPDGKCIGMMTPERSHLLRKLKKMDYTNNKCPLLFNA